MEDLKHLSEITTRYGTRNINELEFKTPEDFAAYKKKHKMRPGTVVKVAGKDKVVGDEPKKDKKPDIDKKVDKQMMSAAEKANMKMNKAEIDSFMKAGKDEPFADEVYDYIDIEMDGGFKKMGDAGKKLKQMLDTASAYEAGNYDMSEKEYLKYKQDIQKELDNYFDGKPTDSKIDSKPKVKVDAKDTFYNGTVDDIEKYAKDNLNLKGQDAKDFKEMTDFLRDDPGAEWVRRSLVRNYIPEDKPDVDPKIDKQMQGAADAANKKMAKAELDDALNNFDGDGARELFDSEIGFKKMGKEGKEAKKLLDRMSDYEYGLVDLDKKEQNDIEKRLKQLSNKYLGESISKKELRELSKITTRYTNRLNENVDMKKHKKEIDKLMKGDEWGNEVYDYIGIEMGEGRKDGFDLLGSKGKKLKQMLDTASGYERGLPYEMSEREYNDLNKKVQMELKRVIR